MCLRIALSVRHSTPIVSLEAENHVPPLYIHRQLTLFHYFARFAELPNFSPVVRDLMDSSVRMQQIQWSYPARVAPLLVRCRELLIKISFPCTFSPSASLMSPWPPWLSINDFFLGCELFRIPSEASVQLRNP